MKRSIVMWPDSRLYQTSKPVETFGAALHPLIDDMIETMKAARGVGLSAIQIGVPVRIMVLGVEDKREVYCNPTIMMGGDLRQVDEGCLSVPGVREKVERYGSCAIQAWDEDGNEVHKVFENELRAQVVQHEMEHLEGRIYLETLGMLHRDRIRKQLTKMERTAKRQGRTLSEAIYGF